MNARNNAHNKISAVILSFTLIIGGCGYRMPAEEETVSEPQEHQFFSLLGEAEINYTVPVSVPNIMVNQLGYLPRGVKMAVFRGETLPDSFQVVNVDTGEVVYHGEVEDRGYNAIHDEHLRYGIFTDLTAGGTYYLEAQIVGRSYHFQIGEDLYDGVFTAAGQLYYRNRCGVCHEAPVSLREDPETRCDVTGGWHQDSLGSRDTVTTTRVINHLLLSYELHGDVYGDQTDIPESGNQIPDILDEIRHGIEWLRRMQDALTGGVHAGVTSWQTDEGGDIMAAVEPVSVAATKMFCAALAKFSYIYQGVDNAYATECLKAADRAWRYLEKNHTDLTDEMFFLAAAEMYRAAGYQVYHRIVVDYLGSEEYRVLFGKNHGGGAPDSRQETIMQGVATYLLTKKWVDRNLCNEIMKSVLLRAEDIAARARLSQYLTAGNANQDNNAELLADMLFLTLVNHIITNHEYGTIIENHLHYFMGRNSAGISYIDDVGALNYRDIDSRLGIMNHIEANARLLFIIAGIKNNG